jgi:predicted phage terminase large subunit-like protein
MTDKERLKKLEELAILRRKENADKAKTDFYAFCRALAPEYYTEKKQYLKTLCLTLQSFYKSELINEITGKPYEGLMIRMPPQTGKSRTLVNFCKWVFGQNHEERIITASYSDDTAASFSRFTRDGIREVKNLPDQVVYSDIFPDVKIKSDNASIQNWALEGQHFSYMGVGVGGGVTSKGATLRIIDDLVKDAENAISKNNQDKIELWLNGTFSSRNSAEGGTVKEIFCATLWTKNDPQYKLQKAERERWYVLQFEIYDQKTDTMLCDQVMGKESYINLKNRMLRNEYSKIIFWANYHSKIIDLEGALYKGLKTYGILPTQATQILCRIDTKEQGADHICAIVYKVVDKLKYVIDVYYTTDNADKTEPEIAYFLKVNEVNICRIESNAGGMAFARNIERISKDNDNFRTKFETFFQSKNKETRIISNSSTVCNLVIFPENWQVRWPEFYDDVTSFIPGAKGQPDDAEDVLTGMVEGDNESYIY